MEHSNIIPKSGARRHSFLDKLYNNYIKNSLFNTDEETEQRWDIYQSVMSELSGMSKTTLVGEAKYRLTGGEDPNQVFLDIINKDADAKASLWIERGEIERYMEQDLLDRFK